MQSAHTAYFLSLTLAISNYILLQFLMGPGKAGGDNAILAFEAANRRAHEQFGEIARLESLVAAIGKMPRRAGDTKERVAAVEVHSSECFKVDSHPCT
jgi:hypothetical protein